MINLLKTHSFFVTKTIESCILLENQGYCNENYLVVADGIKYIVRKLLRDDIDRTLEYSIQTSAYMVCIAAEPLVLDEKNNLMISEFLEGIHKSKLDKEDLNSLAYVLSKLHSIVCQETPITLEIKNQSKEVVKALCTIEHYPKEYALCHNDLNPKNILFSNTIYFIDWEYAGVNDIYFDLACICVEFKLNDKMQDLFLNFYFAGNSFVLEKLEAYKTIYIALCKQWFEEENLILPSQTLPSF